MNNKTILLKIGLVTLLLLCLLEMPYGFYQFTRFFSFVGFTFLSYEANNKRRKVETLIYGALALLFQPFFKIALGRELWNVVDVAVGISLIISIWERRTRNKLK